MLATSLCHWVRMGAHRHSVKRGYESCDGLSQMQRMHHLHTEKAFVLPDIRPGTSDQSQQEA